MVTTRTGKLTDLERIVAFDEVARREPSRVDYIGRALAHEVCFVAEQNEAVIGYGVLTDSFFGNAMLEMLYVDRQFRRSGIGSTLVKFAESLAKTPKLFTSTNLSNKPMQLLLENHGFSLTGYIDNLDEGDPELVYFKRLSGGEG